MHMHVCPAPGVSVWVIIFITKGASLTEIRLTIVTPLSLDGLNITRSLVTVYTSRARVARS